MGAPSSSAGKVTSATEPPTSPPRADPGCESGPSDQTCTVHAADLPACVHFVGDSVLTDWLKISCLQSNSLLTLHILDCYDAHTAICRLCPPVNTLVLLHCQSISESTQLSHLILSQSGLVCWHSQPMLGMCTPHPMQEIMLPLSKSDLEGNPCVHCLILVPLALLLLSKQWTKWA
jgi:hypothetical protein